MQHSKMSQQQQKTSPGKGSPSTEKNEELWTNHFTVIMEGKEAIDDYFYLYTVSLSYINKKREANPEELEKEPRHEANAKDIGRESMDKVLRSHPELEHVTFAYDGGRLLITSRPLPKEGLQFEADLKNVSSNRGSTSGNVGGENDPERSRSKKIRVEIVYQKTVSVDSIANVSHRDQSKDYEDVVRVLNIILRQEAAKDGCLIVGQSFFNTNVDKKLPKDPLGVLQGINSSFRVTQGGLFLNMDASHTLIIMPGKVADFLDYNHEKIEKGKKDKINWKEAKSMLKNLRIKTPYSGAEWKIRGLSERSCSEQTFVMKQRNEGPNEGKVVTVYNYFRQHLQIQENISEDKPCIEVGSKNHPVYIPIELCELVNHQRYSKALSSNQRTLLVEKSRLDPTKRMEALRKEIRRNSYKNISMLKKIGISITTQFTKVGRRILPAPSLRLGRGQELNPIDGCWNLNNQNLAEPKRIGSSWVVASFDSTCPMNELIELLIKFAGMKGIFIKNPADIFKENREDVDKTAPERVDLLLDQIKCRFRNCPKLILCVLPTKKNSDIYGPWKRRCLTEYGIPTQCIAQPFGKKIELTDHYFNNLVLKINAKLGGLNFLLSDGPSLELVLRVPTLILGMDVSHGPPGQTEIPSIAAVVSSRKWPSIYHYRAEVRTQASKMEMIQSLFNSESKSDDPGIMRIALKDFYETSGKKMPEQIIIFRDGVGESQFEKVQTDELRQIINACEFEFKQSKLNWKVPKFIVIVAQKRHHARFFVEYKDEQNKVAFKNVEPGTIVDQQIICQGQKDFYLCAHKAIQGTCRPTHYHVLRDDNEYPLNELQRLVHTLCHIYQRSTRTVSLVAPIFYAHLAAAQVAQMMKIDDSSGSGSSSSPAAPSSSRPVAASSASSSSRPVAASSASSSSPVASSPGRGRAGRAPSPGRGRAGPASSSAPVAPSYSLVAASPAPVARSYSLVAASPAPVAPSYSLVAASPAPVAPSYSLVAASPARGRVGPAVSRGHAGPASSSSPVVAPSSPIARAADQVVAPSSPIGASSSTQTAASSSKTEVVAPAPTILKNIVETMFFC